MPRLEGEPSKPHIKATWKIFLEHGCKRILDAGCGLGWFGKYKPEGIEVIGIDLDEVKLRTAKNYEIVISGDVCRLPFKSSSFDGVLASHILEHVPNDLEAIKEFRRVLRGGGVLIAEAPTPYHGAEADPTHVRSYTIESFRKLAERANFKVLQCRLLGKGIPGFGKMGLHSISYHVGNFLANRLHLLRGFVYMVCVKAGANSKPIIQ